MFHEIEEIFKNENINLKKVLCKKFKVLPFQAEMIMELYNKIDNYKTKTNNVEYANDLLIKLYKRLENGDCNKQSVIEKMAKDYCIKMIKDKNKSIGFLVYTCEMDLKGSITFINEFLRLYNEEKEKLQQGLDVTSISLRKEEMIDKIYVKLIKKQKFINFS